MSSPASSSSSAPVTSLDFDETVVIQSPAFAPASATIVLVASRDSVRVEVKSVDAMKCKLVLTAMESDLSATEIPLDLDGSTLTHVATFLKLYGENDYLIKQTEKPLRSSDIEIGAPWCNTWVRAFDYATLESVTKASNYLECPDMLHATLVRYATMIKGSNGSPEQIFAAQAQAHAN